MVAFISPSQTKEPILAEINSDAGPKGPGGKTYIRVWYSDSEGGGDEFGSFEGPLIPKSNPNPNIKADDHIAPNEVKRPDGILGLPVGHLGYMVVFFNGCKSSQNYEAWKAALAGTKGAPGYLGWTIDTPGISNRVGVLFGEAVVSYFRARKSLEPPTEGLGLYALNYIHVRLEKAYPEIKSWLVLN